MFYRDSRPRSRLGRPACVGGPREADLREHRRYAGETVLGIVRHARCKRRDGVELRLEPGNVVGLLRSGHRPISQHARRLLGQVVSSLEKPRLEEPIVLRYAGEIGGSSRSAA